MQPYFLPYIGYWQLINLADTFVLYDNIEFTRKGWVHRNNILLNGKKKLFTLPIKKDSDYLDIVERFLADNSKRNIERMIKQIEYSYKKAPYFDDVFPMINDIFFNQERNLFNYILYSIQKIIDYLCIDTKIVISSSIDIDHSLKSQDKVLEICRELSATSYINPIGGLKLYNYDDFKKENIKLQFLEPNLSSYSQFDNKFIPSLSIVDLLMFNTKEHITTMLNSKTYKKVYKCLNGKS